MDSTAAKQAKWDFQTEALRFLCVNSRRGMIALLVIVPTMAFMLWHEVPHAWLISWVGLMYVILSIRLLLTFRHEKIVADSTKHQQIESHFAIGTAASGLTLGIGGVLFADTSSLPLQAFIAFILGGMSAGGIPTLSSNFRIYTYFLISCFLPITIWFLVQGDSLHVVMGIMMVLHLSTLWNAALSYNKSFNISLNITHERDELSRQVQQTHIELEKEIIGHQESEKELADSEERYRMILDHAQIGISVIQDGKVAFTNPYACHTLGYSMDKMIGMSLLDVIHPDDLEASKDRMIDVLKNHTIYPSYQLRYIGNNGTMIPAEASAMPITYHGKPAALVIALNISQRIQAEHEKTSMRKELEHVQRLESLGVLAGGIAHDFNNLLAAIMGNAELARMEIGNNTAASEHLKRIETSSMRAADLCKQMLAYAGKGQIHTGPVDLSHLVKELGELLSASLDKKTSIHFYLQEPLPFVEADQTQMQQIIMNLITNADESLHQQGGDIRIRTGITTQVEDEGLDMVASTIMTTKDYVFIEVEDNGCGMDIETKEKMFDPFFTTKFTGRGLGLSAALGIVKSQNGAIQISSRPDQGTRIRVLLPQMKSASPAVTPPLKTVNHEIIATGTILIVEDEEVIRNVAEFMLKQMGFTTLVAENGQQAVEVFEQYQDDITIILLDMTMPVMNGKEALQAIRALKKDVKILLTSGYNEVQVEDLMANDRAIGFIQKPYSIKLMKEKIAKLLKPV